MAGTDFDIHYVANLARLELTPREEETLGSQLAQVLEYVDLLKTLDVGQIEPTAHPIPMQNVFRADETGSSLSNAEALRNAPVQANGLFLVPKIVE
jgi:aspartyl-tRNA(Asn)/glutamyl-tRNA(Gln) amidotransferase subunit C